MPSAARRSWTPAAVLALGAAGVIALVPGPARADWVWGFFAGAAMQRSRLCFAGAVRDAVLFRALQMGRAILMLLAGSVAAGWWAAARHAAAGLGHHGYWAAITPGVVAGAFLFGTGMVLAGGCLAGSLWRLGEGQAAYLWTVAGWAAGSGLGRLLLPLPERLDQLHRGLALPDVLGLPGSAALSLAVLGGGILGLALWDRRQPAVGEELPQTGGAGAAGARWRRLLRAPWPPEAGALMTAALAGAYLALTGRTWSLTPALAAPGRATAFAAGLVLGGFAGAALGHELRWRRPLTARDAGLRAAGGLLMGFGAWISLGCTVGALIGGMASFSLHAWVWMLSAVAGGVGGSWLLLSVGRPGARPASPGQGVSREQGV
ncbi:YeeE/YedE family protein [Caldinitratiruptor microaerophilus]|uniref:Sulphur transport domain-containing protein n=1 Tax=Caldinitratiruptor microaerophilus TaxID=671077 RepID=A0AA35CLB9_9FIRM|nr:YeeE/YedE family protein [Caldinitratiruptor microaerophilus]BDG60523.1 hypothetical protein caldi_16130 [Caldinitratiruptor microaerophilus]